MPAAACRCGCTPHRTRPSGRQPRRDQPPHLGGRQVRLGRHHQVLRDPGCPAALRVPGPPVRQVHVEVRPRLPGRGDIGGENGRHAVLHLAGAPGVLRATHAVASPCLSCAVSSIAMPGPIRSPGAHGSHAAPVPAARRAGPPVPPVRAQQRLHPVRALMPGLLRERPAVRLSPATARTVPKGDLALRRCASTRPSTVLTCASTPP